ncbi:MAG: hypothetical protein ACFCGT_00145, partial [Sandaracinaceae bacterium]
MPKEAPPRKLRVALVFGGTIQAEHTLDALEPVILGYGGEAMLPIPAGVAPGDSLEVLRPIGSTWELLPHARMGGAVWVQGERHPIEALSGPVRLGPEDYGVVTLDQVALFFQMVAGAPKMGWVPTVEAALWAALALSAFIHAAVLVILFLDLRHNPPNTDELSTELVQRFMVTPPPDPLEIEEPPEAGGTETEDPGLVDDEEAGGRAAEEEEGRVGREDAEQEQTEMEGEVTGGAAAVRVQNIGLLGAIRGEEGEENALAEALEGPNLGELLGGLGSDRTVMGRGSGGVGRRGTGSGGGGDGPGTLFGAGRMGTGVGAGRGAGGGRGR